MAEQARRWKLETEHWDDGGKIEPRDWEQPTRLLTGWDEAAKRYRYIRANFNSCGFSRESAARAMADGRLIESAPDLEAQRDALVEALEGFKRELDYPKGMHTYTKGIHDATCEACDLRYRMGAAIARARGQEAQ